MTTKQRREFYLVIDSDCRYYEKELGKTNIDDLLVIEINNDEAVYNKADVEALVENLKTLDWAMDGLRHCANEHDGKEINPEYLKNEIIKIDVTIKKAVERWEGK